MESEKAYMSVAGKSAHASNAGGRSVAESAQSFMDGLTERLANLAATLMDPDNDLGMLRDRMFGIPAEAMAPDRVHGTGGPVNSRAEAVFDQLDAIQRRASSVASLARGLNSRI